MALALESQIKPPWESYNRPRLGWNKKAVWKYSGKSISGRGKSKYQLALCLFGIWRRPGCLDMREGGGREWEISGRRRQGQDQAFQTQGKRLDLMSSRKVWSDLFPCGNTRGTRGKTAKPVRRLLQWTVRVNSLNMEFQCILVWCNQ